MDLSSDQVRRLLSLFSLAIFTKESFVVEIMWAYFLPSPVFFPLDCQIE